MTGPDPHAPLRRLLCAAGLAGEVCPAGHDGSIAALRVPPGEWLALDPERRRRLIASLKDAGFRYVALELAPALSDEGRGRTIPVGGAGLKTGQGSARPFP